MIRYRGSLYVVVEADTQVHPHRTMTPTEKNRMKQHFQRYPKGMKKELLKFSPPIWRSIRSKNYDGCWQVTFSYKLKSGRASAGKTSNFTRCLGYDRKSKPIVRKDTSKPGGYRVERTDG